ncbi:secreted protein [Psychroflexus torquis ATCC 700755]|uniref:Secreted protein n=1 Tax=Psychroflexus torquis (strain ATCC 700755 / CIP 106069 / ACAM 623) TaxID=313595 RepID=K4IWW5_PSYTT|nr:hypothetical protein [Psychroflexus torquis]AFU69945.1 secreted protein [Psychroflexus torquis ATCC 700755]
MNKRIKLLFSIFIVLSFFKTKAQQCPEAQNYVSKIQAANSWTPTERVSSGKKIQAWSQLAAWQAYKCQCDNPDNLTDAEFPKLVQAMNTTKGIIDSDFSAYGSVPRVAVADCKKNRMNQSSNGSVSASNSTSQKLKQSLANYSNAMAFQTQGIEIAKAFANQVKSYSQLNQASSPEALLQEFNNNMQAISELQLQNKADNLNQVTNTLNSTLTDLSTGNHEGALFSALSLIDQGEAKRDARRRAQAYRQQLVNEAANQMSNFYWKAMELNDNAINQYYQRAAYAFTKEEEEYLLKFVEHHNCFKESMTNNFDYSSTSWTKNNCPTPTKVVGMSNNLIAKDIQYIQTAKRKYQLYLKTGREVFQQGAMKFTGLAATENPKTAYYYLMGHYAGVNNPLVAYSSFLTAKSKAPSYFDDDKSSEFLIIKLSLETRFKEAIKENNQKLIENIVSAGLHHAVSIDGDAPIVYAIKVDQPNVVQAFLNSDLEGKTETIITKKVREVIMTSAMLDAPNTVERFSEMGFGVNFTIDSKSPLDIAEESVSIYSFKKISKLKGGQSKYTFENSDAIKVRELLGSADANDTIEAMNIYHSLRSTKSKRKTFEILFYSKNKDVFFTIYESNKEFYSKWVKENRTELYRQFSKDILYKNNKYVYRYLSLDLVLLNNGVNLMNEDLDIFVKEWIGESIVNYNVNDIDFNFIKFPTLSMMKESVLGEKNFNKASAFKAYRDISFYQYESQNLTKFAIDRCDAKLMRTLLDSEHTVSGGDSIYRTHRRRLLARASIVGQANYLGSTWRYRKLQKQTVEDMYYNQHQILDMLIFDYGQNKNTLEYLLTRRFSTRDNEDMRLANPYLKKLIDKLIEKGQLDLETTIPNYKVKGWKKQIKGYKDEKYWKAILDGNYDDRY